MIVFTVWQWKMLGWLSLEYGAKSKWGYQGMGKKYSTCSNLESGLSGTGQKPCRTQVETRCPVLTFNVSKIELKGNFPKKKKFLYLWHRCWEDSFWNAAIQFEKMCYSRLPLWPVLYVSNCWPPLHLPSVPLLWTRLWLQWLWNQVSK